MSDLGQRMQSGFDSSKARLPFPYIALRSVVHRVVGGHADQLGNTHVNGVGFPCAMLRKNFANFAPIATFGSTALSRPKTARIFTIDRPFPANSRPGDGGGRNVRCFTTARGRQERCLQTIPPSVRKIAAIACSKSEARRKYVDVPGK